MSRQNKIIIFITTMTILTAILPACAQLPCPMVKMEVERLPDLNTPRAGCAVALGPDGMPVVFGGHMTGFVLTQTAEYYADGAWHQTDMLYPHDNAFCSAGAVPRIPVSARVGA